jgi:hypothetical protein
MNANSDQARGWRKVRSWIVTIGACWFVVGMVYLMLTGQFMAR